MIGVAFIQRLLMIPYLCKYRVPEELKTPYRNKTWNNKRNSFITEHPAVW